MQSQLLSQISSQDVFEVCVRCGANKSLGEFPPRRGTGQRKRKRHCKVCRAAKYDYRERRNRRYQDNPAYRQANNEAARRYRDRNQDYLSTKARESARASRQIVIALYGGICTCCREDRWQFLALDHVNGGGNVHRRIESTASLYRRLAKGKVADPMFQLLCHNCNSAKGHYGVCPHETERMAA